MARNMSQEKEYSGGRKRYKNYLLNPNKKIPTSTKRYWSQPWYSPNTILTESGNVQRKGKDTDTFGMFEKSTESQFSAKQLVHHEQMDAIEQEDNGEDAQPYIAQLLLDQDQEQADDTDRASVGCWITHHSEAEESDNDLPDDNTCENEHVEEQPHSAGDITLPNPQRRDDIPIYPGSAVQRGQVLALMMAFALRHKLSASAMKDLLNLLNTLVPNCAPSSMYFVEKEFFSFFENAEVHYYCNKCQKYLGKIPEEKCEECETTFLQKESPYMLVMPIAKQLQDMFSNKLIYKLLDRKNAAQGHLYVKKFGQYSVENVITLTWNCDGVPVFKSSQFQLWPVQCTINELPLKERTKNVILHSLYFGATKPRGDTILEPFVDEMVLLGTRGFDWKKNGQTVKTKVYAPICTCDAPARALIQNLKQFNGYFGCGYCKHPGNNEFPGKMTYPIDESVLHVKRTHTKTIQEAREAVEKNIVVEGVKGPSVLMLLPKFDVIESVTPDYMHCALLGVVRQVVNLWTDSANSELDFYLGGHLDALDKELLAMCPTGEVSRSPRTIKDRKFWKASEWKSFVLYYSVFCLKGVLKPRFYKHWLLLVNALHILLQKEIPQNQAFCIAQKCLVKFAYGIQELYGPQNMSYNVHVCCLHLAQSVYSWGPLWATSAFIYEDTCGKLKSLFHGTKGIASQIFKYYFAEKSLETYARSVMKAASENVQTFFSSLFTQHVQKAFYTLDNFVAFGAPTKKEMNIHQRVATETLLGNRVVNRKASFFDRACYNNVLLTTARYSSNLKRNNSVCVLKDNMCYQIQNIAILKPYCECVENHDNCSCISKAVLFCRNLHDSPNEYVYDADIKTNLLAFAHKVELLGDVVAIDLQDFCTKGFLYSSISRMYVIKVPLCEIE